MTQRKRRAKRRHEARVSAAKRQLLRRLQRSRTSARWSTGFLTLAFLVDWANPHTGFSLVSASLGCALICSAASLVLVPGPAHVGRATAKAPTRRPRPRRRA